MKPKLIKTETDYDAALARLEVIFDAEPGTLDGDEAELLTMLIESYEAKAYPVEMPSPLDAIRFRMEQRGLKAKDLIPYIGSASKVSEVLAGKRPLSLTMIRNLANGFGIPAEILLREQGAELQPIDVLQSAKQFPLAEMVKRNWFADFQGTLAEAKNQLEDLMAEFVGPLGSNALLPAMNRQHVRNGGNHDEFALLAWRIRVVNLASRESVQRYKPGTVTAEFLRELARLSYLASGPLLAKEFLNKNGIHLICERHLPKTHLDGAALKLPNGSPVVALTLRHDRLDNFWFTLFHELAHVALHLDQDDIDTFFDDLTESGKKDQCEQEADDMASEALIPSVAWGRARLNRRSSALAVQAFAEELRISPAIPAGRIRFEAADYTIYKGLIGASKLRDIFGV